MDYKILKFEAHGDDDGQLVALENERDIPFEVKRVFHIYDTKENVVRGKHAHLTLEEILICVTGSCKILLDDGEKKEEVALDKPTTGLYIPPHLWREMYDFTEGTVLLVLASDIYDLKDYIKDYEQFMEEIVHSE